MNERIKNAFGEIHAEEELKNRTRAFLQNQTALRKRPLWRRGFAAAFICLLALWIGGSAYFLLLSPAGTVSVDFNPSLELELNRLDQVLSAKSYNPEGERLAKELDLRFVHYLDALKQILSAEAAAPYLEKEAQVSITVLGKTEEKSRKMQAEVDADAALSGENVHCDCANAEEAEAARKAGMSLGKYRMYLKLKEVIPEISPEEVKGLSMRKLQELWEEAERTEQKTESGHSQTAQKGHGNACQEEHGNANHADHDSAGQENHGNANHAGHGKAGHGNHGGGNRHRRGWQ